MIEDRIAELLQQHGVQWKRDGKLFYPTPADVKAVLSGAYMVLKNAPHETQYSQAGILVRKEDEHIDVYVCIGEL